MRPPLRATVRRVSLGCAKCGACCDPVFIDYDVWAGAVADARRYGADGQEVQPRGQWANRIFIAASMRPVGARNGQVMLECRFYDREHAMCRAYDDRPPLCSGYPWYGDEPSSHAHELGLSCSYLLDVPPAERPEDARPLIPLTVL